MSRCCVIMLTLSLTVGALGAPRIGVPPAKRAPVIDGMATEGEWDRAARFGSFQDNTRRRLAERQTWVSLQSDEQRLCVLVESEDSPGEVAVVLAPAGAGEAVSLSITRDARLTACGLAERDWQAACEASSTVADGRWTVELAVPLHLLGLAPLEPRASIPADFVRAYEEPPALTSWAWRASEDAAAPGAEMGTLIFDPDGPVTRVLSTGDVHGGTLNCKIEVIGLTGEPEKVTLFYDTVAGGQQVRRAAVPVTVGAGESAVLQAERALRGEDLPEQIDEVTLWVVTDGFRRVHYSSGRLPVGGWSVLRAMSADWVGGETLTARYDLSGLPVGEFGTSVLSGSLVSEGGAEMASATVPIDTRQVALEMDISDLPAGAYELHAEVTGREQARVSQSVVIPDASQWLGNRIGITDRVPEPFTPLQIEGQTVRCWGREYAFGAGGLPARVTSQGQRLLAGPVELELAADGAAVEWTTTGAHSGDAMQSRALSEGRAGDVSVQSATTVEYDGMMRFDLTLTPERAATIDRLALEIPFAPERATYLVWTDCAGTGNPADERYGALPPEGWASDFVPFVWLGDEDRGMVWFSEGPVHWSLAAGAKPIRVIRRPDRVILRVEMVGQPRQIDEPTTWTFGLQAGPVRPRPEGWRQWTARVAAIATSNDYFGVVPTNLRERPDLIARQQERGNPLLVYTFLGETATNQPEYRYFADEWTRGRTYGTGKYTHASACPGSSFLDFKLHNFQTALDEFPIDGLYYDLAWPGPCYNQSHGHGFVDASGELQPTYPVFAYRELAKRTYQMFHERMPRTHIMAHISGNAICLPITAFADHTLDGEQYAHTVEGNYIGLIPLDKMRAEFTARQFGPIPHFLPELWHRGHHIDPGPTVNMCALTFLHDVLVYPAFHNGTARMQFDQAWEEFGVAEGAEFIPYWSNGELIQSVPAGVRVSAWRRGDAVLLAVANLADEPVEAEMRVDLAGFGLHETASAFDAVNGEALRCTGGRIDVSVQARSLRMVAIGN